MRRMQRSYAVCPCTWFEDVWRAQALPGPEKVLDALRCELVCEDMLGVQEAFKGLEVSWWYTFVNFPTAQTWKIKITIAVSGRRGGLRHWARTSRWNLRTESRAKTWLPCKSLQFRIPSRRWAATSAARRIGPWVDGSMGRCNGVFMSNFRGTFIGLLAASSQLRRHAHAWRNTLKSDWSANLYNVYNVARILTTCLGSGLHICQVIVQMENYFASVFLMDAFLTRRSGATPQGWISFGAGKWCRELDMGPVEHHGNSRAPCAFMCLCDLMCLVYID